MFDSMKMRGHYHIEARSLCGRLLHVWEIDNMLTDINRSIRTQMLLGTYSGRFDDLHIRYFAFGAGTTPTDITDTRLEAEIFRKQVTQITTPSAGIVRSVVSLGSLEANTTIREIGVFCGSGATDAADSGIMISRTLVNIEKNSNIVLNIVRTDTCEI